MSPIQSAVADGRGGFYEQTASGTESMCVCVRVARRRGGGKVCVQAEIPYVALRACQLHRTVLLLKSHILGRFKSTNKTMTASQ